MVSKVWTASISGALACSMIAVAVLEMQKGTPASDVDIIPPVQLANATTAASSLAAVVISEHQNAISHADYPATAHTDPLPHDGLSFPKHDAAPNAPWSANTFDIILG